MLLVIMGWFLGFLLLYAAWRFYRSINWEEPAEPSPDLQAMHRKEAELLHIQEILEDACGQGKLSKQVVEEFDRYCNAEIQDLKRIETAWRDHRRK